MVTSASETTVSRPTTARLRTTALARAECVDGPERWVGEPIAATRTDLWRGTERLSVGDPAEGCSRGGGSRYRRAFCPCAAFSAASTGKARRCAKTPEGPPTTADDSRYTRVGGPSVGCGG